MWNITFWIPFAPDSRKCRRSLALKLRFSDFCFSQTLDKSLSHTGSGVLCSAKSSRSFKWNSKSINFGDLASQPAMEMSFVSFPNLPFWIEVKYRYLLDLRTENPFICDGFVTCRGLTEFKANILRQCRLTSIFAFCFDFNIFFCVGWQKEFSLLWR